MYWKQFLGILNVLETALRYLAVNVLETALRYLSVNVLETALRYLKCLFISQ